MKARDRSRVSYPRAMRDRAKAEGKGLLTIHIVEPDGRVTRHQGPATDAKRAAAYELLYRIWSPK